MAYTTIDDPGIYFNIITYTGNGDATRTISGAGFEPDFIINKNRSASGGNAHFVWDAVRGDNKALQTNDTVIESDVTSDYGSGGMGSSASDGFNIVSGTSNSSNVNNSSDTFVAWCWKESATAGFDMVGYTGTGSATTVSHSLSALPHRIIIKKRSAGGTDWLVFGDKVHTTPHDKLIKLNQNGALGSSLDSSWFNDTNPTSSVFSVGTQGDLNGSSATYIAYLFTSIQGFSKFGSYTGNNNANGTFVFLGFRPAYLMVKKTDGTDNWTILDKGRSPFNPVDDQLYADSNVAEADADVCDFVSNGVKFRGNGGSYNGNGNNYIYMAFAEAPLVNSEGVPCNAK